MVPARIDSSYESAGTHRLPSPGPQPAVCSRPAWKTQSCIQRPWGRTPSARLCFCTQGPGTRLAHRKRQWRNDSVTESAGTGGEWARLAVALSTSLEHSGSHTGEDLCDVLFTLNTLAPLTQARCKQRRGRLGVTVPQGARRHSPTLNPAGNQVLPSCQCSGHPTLRRLFSFYR